MSTPTGRPSSQLTFGGHTPAVHPQGWVAPTAMLIGDVEIGSQASVFYGAVVRADHARIVLGDRSNLQDLVAVHADPGFPTTIGSDVTVGHGAILHGCSVEDGSLIGMGAIVLNGAVIGAGSLVAGGALVLGGTVIPAGSLVAGSPAKVRRPLTDTELQANLDNSASYVELARRHREAWAEQIDAG